MRKPAFAAIAALAAALCVPSFADEHRGRHEYGERADHHERHERDLPSIVRNKAWLVECGSCHVAYPPGMLPEQSWRTIMAGLDSHFGENASLDPPVRAAITEFLAANAGGRDGRRVERAPAGAAAPLRITELGWFQREHRELAADVWKRKEVGSRANCGACHRGAEDGRFDEHEVAVPGSRRRREG